ncbi:MAG: uracil phosphoribosyltransferase [Opitutales bacterium]|jgi:uracil phosphoribosyltransferase
MPLHVIQHPAAIHYINQLRRRETTHQAFRRYCDLVTTFIALEASRDLLTRREIIETPLEQVEAEVVSEPVVALAILRAGAGMVDSVVRLLPEVSVGYIGLERNEETAEARRYYSKFPPMKGARVLVVDPMLATGGSSREAIRAAYEAGAARVDFLCIVAAPEGIRHLEEKYPGVAIYTGAVDRELDDNKYIRPGLGDFGDRLYGT